MADVDVATMRSAVEKLLVGVDLTTTTIGSLRASLEKSLGLKAGGLESRKAEVNAFITEVISDSKEGKRKAPEPSEPPAAKKDKKDKKDKTEKKDKKEKAEKKEKKVKRDAAATQDLPEQGGALEGGLSPAGAPEAAALEAEALPAEAPVVHADADMFDPPSAFPDPTSDFLAPAKLDDTAFGATDSMFADFTDEALAATEEQDPLRSKIWAVSGAEDGTLRLWNLEDFSCPRVIEAHGSTVNALVVDWSDKRCLSGAADGCKLWDLRRGICVRAYPAVQGGCLCLASRRMRDGLVVCGAGDGSLHVWDVSTGEPRDTVPAAHPGGVWALEVSWERRQAATGGDASLKVWDMNGWTCLFRIDDHPGGIMGLSVDWAGLRVLVATGICGRDPRMLRLWDLQAKTAQMLSGCEDTPANLEVRWAKDVAVTGGWDAQVRTWRMQDCLCTHTYSCDFGRVRSIAVDFDNEQVLCGSSAGSLHLVDLRTDRVLQTLEGHIGGVTIIRASF